jgi:hypothetical protein
MHGPINVKSLNNTSKWQMGFNSAFKGLIHTAENVADYVSRLRHCVQFWNMKNSVGVLVLRRDFADIAHRVT